jgi:integrase/recombinase XerD
MAIRKTEYGYQVDLMVRGFRHKQTFKSREEAREHEKELKLKRSDILVSSRVKIEKSVSDYKAQFSSQKSKATEYNEGNYFEQFKDFMKELKVSFVHEIELQHLQKLQKHLLSRGVSGATVNRQFNTYKNYIKECRLWKATPSDPCFGLKSLKFTSKRKKLWSKEDIIKVKDALTVQWHRDALYLCATTGLRPVEVCRLEWTEVNLEEKLIRTNTFKGRGGGVERVVELTDDQVIFLKALKKRQKFPRYVLVNTQDRRCQRIHLTNAVTETAKGLGLHGYVLYGIKHTFASHLRAQGTDIETIRQALGHTNLRTTQAYLQNLGTQDVVRKAMEDVHKKIW